VRNRRYSLSAVLLLFSAFACGQVAAPARFAKSLSSITPEKLKADLTFLSSDPLEGRMSLQRGSEVAAQWVASEFAKAGLKPASGDSFLQPIELIEYRLDPNRTALTLRKAGVTTTLKYFDDFLGSFPDDVSVGGPVIFAGYGITAPEFNYDDYSNIDATGKIVLIFDHEPQENDPNSIFNGIGNTRYAGYARDIAAS